jgi:hypothetical protein
LRTASGGSLSFAAAPSTLLLKAKRTAQLADFASGDAVTVRYRPSATQPYVLHDLADRASWTWLARLRTQVAEVTLKEVTDADLVAEEGPDSAPIRYRVTATTAWRKAGKPAESGDFPAGSRVSVAPRLLPNGRIMAVGVADTKQGAEGLRERSRPTVTGRITLVDVTGCKIVIVSLSGEAHAALWHDAPRVRKEGRDVPLGALAVGQWVTAHLKKDEAGDRLVTLVTIKPKPSAPTAASNAPVKR